MWKQNGLTHRDADNPALVRYSSSGSLLSLTWIMYGCVHRNNDLPARIEYYENGNEQQKEWYENDQNHRLTGPAIIQYTKKGNILETDHYVDNEYLTKAEWEQNTSVQEYHRQLKNNSKNTIVTDISL